MTTVKLETAGEFRNLQKLCNDSNQKFTYTVSQGLFEFTANSTFLSSIGY